MTLSIEQRLRQIPIGQTTTVNGHVVTRWAVHRWEVETLGKAVVSLEEATAAVAK